MARVAINGFGRIGRAAFKIALDMQGLEVAAINDLIPSDNLAYLLKYDTVYGRYEKDVRSENNSLVVDGKDYPLLGEEDLAKLPWGDMGVDIVLECTGVFTKRPDLEKHLRAGAKTVILSANAKSDDIPTIIYGVNRPEGKERIISCASCTTNCVTPVVEVVGRRIGIEKAIMTTVHAYTATQALVDGPSEAGKFRRGRAAAANLVPTTTGAAKATAKALTEYKAKFDAVAVRVPVPAGSISDIVFVTKRATSVDEVNNILREEAGSDRYRQVMGCSDEPLVSSDVVKDPRASIIDLGMTQVVDGNLVKIMSWYDNEWGYAGQMIREAMEVSGIPVSAEAFAGSASL